MTGEPLQPLQTYRLTTIADLLKVPADRREDCVRGLLYALLTQEIAFGDDAGSMLRDGITWTDDGDLSVSLRCADGEELATLNITKYDPS
ncbi:hypothetical protein [Nevskia sp.]|uniref:hypothetical protein n=1 Tax=Nevskia sp. TaxID=1929292 RepID=UPI0025DD8C8C|nr:hypothetical protein [Nevskia sp.]